MTTHLQITYGSDNFPLIFKLHSHNVVQKWVEKIHTAQLSYSIDDPKRFYGFGTVEIQTKDALLKINECVNTINSHQRIINKTLSDVNDQDTLNYLHHIFEIYHGLLNKQTHEFWETAPLIVRHALANLNLLVHRCESIARGAKPRHVVTYYGLPKTSVLALEDYELFNDVIEFGTVYLNYVEIGKTFEDLANDNDVYIHDSAFQPFVHYSADFNVKFWSDTDLQVSQNRAILNTYYDKNFTFFKERNLERNSPLLAAGSIPLATLVDAPDNLIEILTARQEVTSVTLI